MSGQGPVRAGRFGSRAWLCIFVLIASLASARAEPLLSDEEKEIGAAIAKLKDPEYRLDDSLSALAETLIARGRVGAAEALYRRVVEEVDFGPGEYLQFYEPPFWMSPGRMSNRIIQVLEVAYPELIKLLIARGEHEQALAYVNRCRSRLLEAVIQSKLNNRKPAASFPVMDVARMRRLASETRSTFVVYALLSSGTRYFSLARQTGPKSAKLVAWVVQPNGKIDFASLPIGPLLSAEQEPEEDAVYQAVATFSRTVARGIIDRMAAPQSVEATAPATPQDRKARLEQLHEALVAPLERYLPQHPEDKVVIVPDASLYLVPFNALIDAGGTYLVERHTLSVVPSLGIYALLNEKAKRSPIVPWKRQRSVLVVGNPTMPSFPESFTLLKDAQLPQLDGADKEARSIAALFHVRPLIGDQALEDVVRSRMEKARIIHFATHGLLVQSSVVTVSQVSGSMSQDLPPGAIALTANPAKKPAKITQLEQYGIDMPYNGFLAAGKILTLDLDADLVALSACDTARGRTYEQQFVGLPSALLAAGARSVVMTLWSIPDAPTAELMIEFYRGLLAGRSKPAALRQAILLAKESHPDPQDWGAFTLVGLAD